MALRSHAQRLTVARVIDRQAMNSLIPAIELPGPTLGERDRALRTLASLAVRSHVGAPELLDLARMLGLLPDEL